MLDVSACASQSALVQTESKGARNGNIRNATKCKVRKGCPELNLRNATKCKVKERCHRGMRVIERTNHALNKDTCIRSCELLVIRALCS